MHRGVGRHAGCAVVPCGHASQRDALVGGQGASHELVAWCLLPLGSSACLASLRSAAAKLEEGAAWADSVLLVAGLPVGTRAPLSGEGVRGLTVAVVLVAVESIPIEGDLGSWLMPETGKEEPVSPREQSASTRGAAAAACSRSRRPREQSTASTADSRPVPTVRLAPTGVRAPQRRWPLDQLSRTKPRDGTPRRHIQGPTRPKC